MWRMSPAGMTAFQFVYIWHCKYCLADENSFSFPGQAEFVSLNEGICPVARKSYDFIDTNWFLFIARDSYREEVTVTVWTKACNTQLLFVRSALWWKCVLLESLDYLKMDLARHLIFCHDFAFSPFLCQRKKGTFLSVHPLNTVYKVFLPHLDENTSNKQNVFIYHSCHFDGQSVISFTSIIDIFQMVACLIWNKTQVCDAA